MKQSLAAPAEPALGHDAPAPAGHPAASAFHHGAAHRSPGGARLQPHAGAGRGRRRRRGPGDRDRSRRHSARAPGRQRVGGHLRLRSARQCRVDRRVRRHRPRRPPGPDRIAEGSTPVAGVPDAALRHRPGDRGRARRRRRRRRLSHADPRRHPAQSRSPARGGDARTDRSGASPGADPRSPRGSRRATWRNASRSSSGSFPPTPSGATPRSPW